MRWISGRAAAIRVVTVESLARAGDIRAKGNVELDVVDERFPPALHRSSGTAVDAAGVNPTPEMSASRSVPGSAAFG